MDAADERNRRSIARLLRFFRPAAGRWRAPTGAAWQLALAIEAVLTTYERTREEAYLDAVRRWFARHRDRRSAFYDDDGWYVNAWLRAHEVTADPRFLEAARAGFADLLSGWDDVCGGGLWWSRRRTYKNAITTGLFGLAAARLNRLDWTVRAWEWFDRGGLVNDHDLVNDGLDSCVNNGGPTWTYNQGVVISWLVELFRATGDPGHLARARRVADATMATLVHPGGILREPSEPGCDRDQEIFKGVCAQGLARLSRADPAGGGAYRSFLVVNADSVWRTSRDARDGLGLSWCGPVGRVTPATHASASLLLAEVALAGPADAR